jgi:hypothetical protein
VTLFFVVVAVVITVLIVSFESLNLVISQDIVIYSYFAILRTEIAF